MKFLFSFLVVLFIFLIGSWFWWIANTEAPNSHDTKPSTFVIAKGQDASVIAANLAAKGFIKNELAFKIYTQLTGKQGKIQAGFYRISPSLTLAQVVDLLVRGPEGVWIVYPEGVRREEIAAITIKSLGLKNEEAERFWQQFLSLTAQKEGFLFPDTYLFALQTTPEQVVSKMLENFKQKWNQLSSLQNKSSLDKKNVIVLASIIERETKTNEERPIVAGILLKRLRASWPLQADAALQFVLGKKRCEELSFPDIMDCNWWIQPKGEDKSIISPYNTYTQPSLPPAPIANPGLSSIKAVLQPQDSPYWFYLHDKSGNIHYARTIQEHNQNIHKYLD